MRPALPTAATRWCFPAQAATRISAARERAFLKSRFPPHPSHRRCIVRSFHRSPFQPAVALASLALDDDAPISRWRLARMRRHRQPQIGDRHQCRTFPRRRHRPQLTEDAMSKAAYKDHLGRPLVAVTGMGVVSSLGQGDRRQLDSADLGKIRHSPDHPVSVRRPVDPHLRHR
jgi:hypothetical protein